MPDSHGRRAPARKWLPIHDSAGRCATQPLLGRGADESWHGRSSFEPAHDSLFIGATSQNDAADFAATSALRDFHDTLAVLAPIESFDLPDIRFDARILQSADSLEHQSGTKS